MSVNWADFYYEEERFLAAYRWLVQTAASFPIALVGRVSNVETIETHGRLLYVLNFEPSSTQSYALDSTVGERTCATVWTSQPNWLYPLKRNDTVLVFGHCRHATAHTFTSPCTKRRHKVSKVSRSSVVDMVTHQVADRTASEVVRDEVAAGIWMLSAGSWL
jgi:hypothetical protein